jgi:hypothetical protein
MNLAAFAASGYSPVPLRGGRPVVAGLYTSKPTWRFQSGEDRRFPDCVTGILCTSLPLPGSNRSVSMGVVSQTWVAGVRWETSDKRLNAEIGALVERIAGLGPTRSLDTETLRVFKVERPFTVRKLHPMYLPRERYTELRYKPHRLEVLSIGGYLNVSNGTWRNGSLPETPRNDLPAITRAQAELIANGVEQLFRERGASPWIP